MNENSAFSAVKASTSIIGLFTLRSFLQSPSARAFSTFAPGGDGQVLRAGRHRSGREGGGIFLLPSSPPPPPLFFFPGVSAPSPGFPRPSGAHPRRAAFHLKRRKKKKKKAVGVPRKARGPPGPFSGSPHPGSPRREAAGGRSGNAEPSRERRPLRAPRRENRPPPPPPTQIHPGKGWSAVRVKTLATHGQSNRGRTRKGSPVPSRNIPVETRAVRAEQTQREFCDLIIIIFFFYPQSYAAPCVERGQERGKGNAEENAGRRSLQSDCKRVFFSD